MSTIDFGIKYLKAQLDEKTYLLVSKGIVVGSSCSPHFYTEDQKIDLLSREALRRKSGYIVDSVIEIEKYKIEQKMDDVEFLSDYYWCEEKNNIILVTIEKDRIIRNKLSIDDIKNKTSQEIYEYIGNQAAVVLNERALNDFLSLKTVDEMKLEIQRYKDGVENLYDYRRNSAVSKIVVQDGRVASIETEARIIDVDEKTMENRKKDGNMSGISLDGLIRYVTERVYGHEEEIKKIATVLMMNLTAQEVDGTETILIPGPTGVGKTATLEAASEYLNVPFLSINTPNLVPSGIKGESLETNLLSLYFSCGKDLEKMKKAIVVLDEFDKINDLDLDIKEAVKPLFLKFIEGGVFTVDVGSNKSISVSTKLFSKMLLGSFSELFKTKRHIGLGSVDEDAPEVVDAKMIYNSKYFSKELISRVPHIITFGPLDDYTKKKVILESKLSAFLKKKERIKRDYGIDLVGQDEFADALIEKLAKEDKSMRDINNMINNCLLGAEFEILNNPNRYHTLKLNRDIVEDYRKFDLS